MDRTFVQSQLAKRDTSLSRNFVLHRGKHPKHYAIKGTQITRYGRKARSLLSHFVHKWWCRLTAKFLSTQEKIIYILKNKIFSSIM